MYKKLLEMSENFELQKMETSGISKTHSPFEGTPKKHPNDENIIILIIQPFSTEHKFYEFPLESIGKIDDLGTIISESGESAPKMRLWVKKGMPGLHAESFIVR